MTEGGIPGSRDLRERPLEELVPDTARAVTNPLAGSATFVEEEEGAKPTAARHNALEVVSDLRQGDSYLVRWPTLSATTAVYDFTPDLPPKRDGRNGDPNPRNRDSPACDCTLPMAHRLRLLEPFQVPVARPNTYVLDSG